jgi:hypothetical protein
MTHMTTASHIRPRLVINRIDDRRAPFLERAQAVRELTAVIASDWANLEDDDRAFLKEFAYHVIRGPKTFMDRIRYAMMNLEVFRASLYPDGVHEAIIDYSLEIRKLVQSILEITEREEKSFQDALASSMQSYLSQPSTDNDIVKDKRAWLRELSDKALR